MRVTHRLYAVPPGRDKKKEMGRYEASEWQFAEKRAEHLRELGYGSVEVVTVYEDSDDD